MNIFSKILLLNSKCTLTVVTTPSNATCTLTCDGVSYSQKTLTVKMGSVISYSIYHSTYGSKTGMITMNSNKTLTCTGTSSPGLADVSFSQPTLSADGTLGGSSFAVSASHEYTKVFRAFDGDTTGQTSCWQPQNRTIQQSPYLIMYFPNAVKVKTITIMNRYAYPNCCPRTWYLYCSTDNSSYTYVNSGTNTNLNKGSEGGSWTITGYNTTSTSLSYYYEYWKIAFAEDWTGTSSAAAGIQEITVNAYYLSTTTTYSWSTTVTDQKTDTYPWGAPILSANGTLGGSSFAVEASSEYSDTRAAYTAFDDSSTYWRPSDCTILQTYTFYNPVAINVTKIEYQFYSTTYNTTIDLIEGSNDNTNWTTITRADSTSSNIETSTLDNSEFYKYYRTTFAAKSSGTYRLRNMAITATAHI